MKTLLIFSSFVFLSEAQFGPPPRYGTLGRFVRGGFGFGSGGGGGGGGGRGFGGGGGGGGYSGGSSGGGGGGGGGYGGGGGGSLQGSFGGGGDFGGSGGGGGYGGGGGGDNQFGKSQGGFQQSQGGFGNGQQGGFHGGGGDNEESKGGKIHKYVSIHVAPPEPPSQRPSKQFQQKERETHYQIVFIKAPHNAPGEGGEIQLPPPPETKTLVYVLLKRPELSDMLRFPKPSAVRPSKPEVYFIRYKGGDKNKKGGGDEGVSFNEGGHGGGDFNSGGGSGPSAPSGGSQRYGPPN